MRKAGQLIFRCAKSFSGAEKYLQARLRCALGAGIKVPGGWAVCVNNFCVNNFCINQNKNIDNDLYCNSNEFPNHLFY